jgi:hypothetical protein
MDLLLYAKKRKLSLRTPREPRDRLSPAPYRGWVV